MCSDCSWEEAIETADEILEICDELPEAGDEFRQSVEEKTRRIRAWIQEHEHCTDKQVNALENMHRGAEKWLQD